MEPEIGEDFVWLEAIEGQWGEQVEIVRGVLGARPGEKWLIEYWDDNDERRKVVTLVSRNSEGRLVRA
jgi:hypothetical protein